MFDKGSKDYLTITRLPGGGYVVADQQRYGEVFHQLFATANVDDALKFIRDAITPVPPQQEQKFDPGQLVRVKKFPGNDGLFS